MSKNLLSDKQLKTAANDAMKSLRHAQSLTSCIAEEIGTPVAADMAAGAIEFTINALTCLNRIAVQLRIRAAIDNLKKRNVRACRKCGCTHTTPCVDPRTGATCHWVAMDLCSACAPKAKKGGAS
jgi:hypothetical protein